MSNIFVIGVGGTGMRCLEAFIHLCAIGMFDNTNVHLLALDTDKENGNFRRLKELKEAYLKVKGVNKTHYALKDTFFSANLHYYQFSPDYSNLSTFSALFNYEDIKHKNPDEAAIADLLFTNNVKEFDLKHGYRAQTHLGSLLMYHSIIEDIKNNNNSDLRKFIEQLISFKEQKPRVFVLGSVFGGTGASSIPIIPKAIKEAAAIKSEATNIEADTYFGATLITGYFTFPLPDNNEREKQKIIATADKFALNSQAAMMFYEADETVKSTYQRFYMMGTETIEWNPSKNKNKTITGGGEQENDSHYIELLAAFAAYDFFNCPQETLEGLKNEKKVEYLYRTFNENGKIDFQDYVGSEKKEEFAKKLGMFTAMSYLALLDNYDFFVQVQSGNLKKVKEKEYENIDFEEVKNLKKYMELFHFQIEGNNIKDGWLRQVHRSAKGGNNFLLSGEVFTPNSINDLKKFNFNTKLYQEGSAFEKNKFKPLYLWLGEGDSKFIFDEFIDIFIDTKEVTEVTNKMEKLIKRTYDTLCKLYKFNEN